MKTEIEKMLAGELYLAEDSVLVEERKKARKLSRLYNRTTETESEKRKELLKELLGSTGKSFSIEPTFKSDTPTDKAMGFNTSIASSYPTPPRLRETLGIRKHLLKTDRN